MINWDDVEKQYKLFEDPVNGYMKINTLCLEFIDTPQFQRLRHLKQLGTLSYIFPSATHTRFEHSLGVGYLSGHLMKRFKEEQPELGISNRDINIVKLSGYLHDIGHGPFSHVFDNEFIPLVNPNSTYSHEQMSIDMIDYMIEDNNIDIEKEDSNLIKNIIMGAKKGVKKIDKREYMYEIVANKNNCIDVDKLDYLSRDMHHLFGNTKSYNFTRIYKYNRIIDNTICYNSKVVFDIYDLFQQRYSMHKQIYNHRKGKSIEYMIRDILYHADSELKISQSIESPAEFLNITDNVLYTIQTSKNINLKKSQDIIKRLDQRKLYKFIDEYIIPSELSDKIPKPSAVDISTNNVTSNININPDDIIVYDNRLNYNLNDKNPVDNVYFYDKDDLNKKFQKNKKDISLLLPNVFEERVLRIYSTNLDINVNNAIKLAFDNYLKKYK
jgi:HD superfamily phosphohydrolase